MTGASGFDRGRQYPGTGITVSFEAARCRHFAECVRGLPEVFDVTRRPWIDTSGAPAELIAEVVERCPSGALQYRRDDGLDETATEPTTVRRLDDGAILVRGDFEVLVDGEPTPRAETRAALCGCGRSEARPYCDGACVVAEPA